MSSNEHLWKPNVTVAAVVTDQDRFLLVEEETSQGIRYNQPAGHLEPGESLIEAVIRETREETAWVFTPTALLGVYQYRHPGDNVTYLRFAFTGDIADHHPRQPLDEGILRALWMPVEEIRAKQNLHRSPLLLQCVEDHLAGRRFPLELIHHYN